MSKSGLLHPIPTYHILPKEIQFITFQARYLLPHPFDLLQRFLRHRCGPLAHHTTAPHLPCTSSGSRARARTTATVAQFARIAPIDRNARATDANAHHTTATVRRARTVQAERASLGRCVRRRHRLQPRVTVDVRSASIYRWEKNFKS